MGSLSPYACRAGRGRQPRSPLIRRITVFGASALVVFGIWAGCYEPVRYCRNDSDCPENFICDTQICCAKELHPPRWSGDGGPDGGPDAGEPVYRRINWKPLRPNVMLVVDRSGSMTEPVDNSCTRDVRTCCTTDGSQQSPYSFASPNPCKWKDLLSVLTDSSSGLLLKYESRLRWGLAMFPEGTSCTAGRVYQKPDETNAGAVSNTLRTATPVGGTPTAGTLDRLTSESSLQDPLHTSYVMLVTDGSPNCNSLNAAKCTTCTRDATQCRGPINADGTSAYCNPSFTPCSSPFNGAGCLDGDGVVAAIGRLKQKNILTLVFGFGSETATPDAYAVLNAAAVAGGLPRSGMPRYYQANNAVELAAFLDSIARSVPQCKFEILEDVPRDKLRVILDGAIVLEDAQDGYTYDEGLRLVAFVGSTCRVLSDGLEHDTRFETPQ